MPAAKNKGRGTANKSSKSSSSRAKKPAGIPRDAWGFIMLILAILAALALFGANGAFISSIASFCGGVLGFGFYFLPFSLACAAVLLFVRRKDKNCERAFLILLLPIVAGALWQVFSGGEIGQIEDIKGMYASGAALSSGGVICGSIGIFMRWALSTFGAAVLLFIAIAAVIMLSFSIGFADIGAFFARLRVRRDEDDYYKAAAVIPPQKAPQQRYDKNEIRPQQNIDIPISGDEKRRAPQREGLFDNKDKIELRPAAVPTPAEAYMETHGLAKPAQAAKADGIAPPLGAKPDDKEGRTPDVTAQRPSDSAKTQEETVPEEEKKEEKLSDLTAKEIEDAIHGEQKSSYRYPPISLLNEGLGRATDFSSELETNSIRLVDTLMSFGIESKVTNITRGPTVTRYEMQISRGIKFSKIVGLSDDIALSLGAASVRIAPIPDKVAIGIEVPNQNVTTVYIRDIIGTSNFRDAQSKLSFAVGKDIAGQCVVGDIAKMPHMLIAGTTGSGKSVCINSLLISLIYKSSPEEVRLIMIDPKMIELGIYNGIPHLLIPVVTDPKKAAGALNWAVAEMMKRYKLFAEHNVRDLASYNEAVKNSEEGGEPLPRIVIVIDELADLMFVAKNEVEESVARIAQMARAAGMHLVIATQRPSADVITGIMKANIPSRIAFAVASQIESRIILDAMGAEKLIGKGDMLYYPLGSAKPMRVQGCLISSGEVESVVEFIKRTGTADYSNEVIEHIERQSAEAVPGAGGREADGEYDEFFSRAVEVVMETGQASVSMLQRRLKLGYARAARLIDQMEERGIVGPFEGSKPRQILITKDEWKEMVLRQMD